MKKVILAIIILAIILTAGILENIYVEKVFDTLNQKLVTLQVAIEAEDEDALAQLTDITAWWEKKRGYLELFTYSTDLRAFSAALGETDGSLRCGDFNNALSKTRSLIVMAQNIRKILDFNIVDII